MGALDSAVGLLVAVSDLKVVRAITRAINANLPKDGPLGTSRPSRATLQPRPRGYFTPLAGPQAHAGTMPLRTVTRASPLSGPIFDYYDRFGCGVLPGREMSAAGEASVAWTMDGPTRPACVGGSTGPVEAPWRHLPPVADVRVELDIKVIRPKVDLITKGMLLDLFA